MAKPNKDNTVKHQERRESKRQADPSLAVKIDGKTYKTTNWSMGGMFIEGYEGTLTTGALVTVGAFGASIKKLTDVNVRARVINADQEKKYISINFLDLDGPAFGLLKEFINLK